MTSVAFRRNLKLHPSDKVDLADRTLVIGDLARWAAEGREISTFDAFHFTAFDLLTKELLLQINPVIILSPLMAGDFDVLEVGAKLVELGFSGRYRAITNDLPNADMVVKEVRSHAPGLDFDLLVMRPVANDS